MKERFEHRRLMGLIALTLSDKTKWSKDKALLCKEIKDIMATFANEGYILTLRQLYYQLVAADAIRNDDVVYKKMSGILDDLRYSGAVDWTAIEDRGRVPYIPWFTDSVESAIGTIVRQYRLDRQIGQPCHVEVWTEKDAISGILKRVTSEYQIQLVVNKGYSSSSAMHNAYTRFAEMLNSGKNVKILYFGDHDPSGLDMLRDIRERILFFIANGDQVNDPECEDPDWDFYIKYLNDNGLDDYDMVEQGLMSEAAMKDKFGGREIYGDAFISAAKTHYWATRFEVVPIGLTMEQIKKYNPPPNPAKMSDPRAEWYIRKFGNISWEVDALPPNVMANIVTENIEANLDLEIYEGVKQLEWQHIQQLKQFQKLSRKGGEK